MKNLLYIIVGLLLVIWGILFWGLHASGPVHILLGLSGLIILIRLVFDKQLTNKKINFNPLIIKLKKTVTYTQRLTYNK